MTHTNLATERQGTVRATPVLLLSETHLSGPRRSGEGMQIELVERARSGDHEAFSTLVRDRGSAAAGCRAADPPRRRPRPGRGPGGARPRLAERARPARPGRVGRLALPPDRAVLLPGGEDGEPARQLVELHVVPDREPAADLDFSAVARRARPASVARSAGCRSTSARSWSCTSISTCR